MPYAPILDLDKITRNHLLGYQITLDGRCGVCFVIGDLAPAWMTKIDLTVQFPDEPTTEGLVKKSRRDYLIDLLRKIGTAPLENQEAYESVCIDARLAIEDWVVARIVGLTDDLLDTLQFNFSLNGTILENGTRPGFSVTITPVFRSGTPTVTNAEVFSYDTLQNGPTTVASRCADTLDDIN